MGNIYSLGIVSGNMPYPRIDRNAPGYQCY